MQTEISISQISSVSSLGTTSEEIWQNYLDLNTGFVKRTIQETSEWVNPISASAEDSVTALRNFNTTYDRLDRSVLLALLASRNLNSEVFTERTGVNIGSSRGATELFERFHAYFEEYGTVPTLTSPTTTLGNISSWIAQDLNIEGPQISHSVTCSTALHSILNAIAWMQANMADSFVVGGTEAPLTPFTIAQMKALKLYSKQDGSFPCESLKLDKTSNTMILGEAASLAYLEKGRSDSTLAMISGFGYASEKLDHAISLSSDAQCFQKSMQMALSMSGLETVDAIVMHAPGTIKGDKAEMTAVNTIFGNKLPFLTTNKVLVGHTLGASGMISVEMAILMLQHNKFIQNPFYNNTKPASDRLETVMINAVGFGGNAVSIIVTK